ncbi:MAG: proline racemase family protein, partial [Albidovulum sp.]
RGEMGVGDDVTGVSIIGSRFNCRIERVVDLGGTPAIIPSVSGRGWISETKTLLLDPDDPWPEGYRVGDTWPMQA